MYSSDKRVEFVVREQTSNAVIFERVHIFAIDGVSFAAIMRAVPSVLSLAVLETSA